MVDTAKVKAELAVLMNCSEEELNGYGSLISSCALSVEDEGADEATKARLALLAAARANYLIALAVGEGSGVTSFKAGDVSISESRDGAQSALALLEELEAECHGIAGDAGFAFRTV